MHEDHLKGLTGGEYGNADRAPNLNWNYGPIYCSSVTHRIMLLRFPNLEPYLVPIPPQTWYEVCVLPKEICPDDCKDTAVRIRFIDANHCPGAMMIHISGPLGEVLHTGDFRYGGKDMLSQIGEQYKFDHLYLDNTFATPMEDFPPQEEAYKILFNKIVKIRKEDENAKFYLYCYTLGKEEVFFNLANDL